jgi:hypothetical protein
MEVASDKDVGEIHRSCRETGGTPVRDGMNDPYMNFTI